MASRISSQKINSHSSSKQNRGLHNSSDDQSVKTNQDSSFQKPSQSGESTIIEGGSSED